MIRVGSPRFSQGKPKKLVEEQWGINSKHIRQLLASDFTDGYRFPIERNHRLLTHARVQVDLDATDKLILMFFHHNLCGVPDVVARAHLADSVECDGGLRATSARSLFALYILWDQSYIAAPAPALFINQPERRTMRSDL